MRDFSLKEQERYARHTILPEIGESGQRKLKEASVLLVGTGGLGSPSSMYLAAAGVGRIGLIDFDVVDVSNLQRQIVHGESTLGQKKVESAKKRLQDINPYVDVMMYDCKLAGANVMDIVQGYDIVVDGTDNFAARYLVNDACILLGKANVYASVFRFDGQVSVFDAKRGPCYRCLFANPPPPGVVPSCGEGGVLGVLPGIAGTLQATEVIKLITGIGESLIGSLLTFNALTMEFFKLKVSKDPHCLACSSGAKLTIPGPEPSISAQELKSLLAQGDLCLLDVREADEWAQGHIGGAQLIPVGELSGRVSEIPTSGRIVIYCKTGVRSEQALKILRNHGVESAASLYGGYNKWTHLSDSN